MHDFELTHTRRPKVLVQTAGHVAGGAYYYQKSDVINEEWGPKKVPQDQSTSTEKVMTKLRKH